MRLHSAWLSVLPVFALTVACAETRTPTELAAEGARFEVVETPAECVGQIDALIARTADPLQTPLTGAKAETKERPGLLATLNAARDLVEIGKPADAVKKLQDYIVKVENLAGAGRLAPDIAASLIAEARAAIACIQPASL